MNPNFDLWMVRSPQHQIKGMFSKEELIAKIQAGEFSQDYEICPGNGYWIYLYETKELETQLGIALPSHLLAQVLDIEVAQDEITQDFPEESSRTMQFNPKPKPAPLAPRNTIVEPPPAPNSSGKKNLMKVIFILLSLFAVWLVTRS